MSSVFDLFGSSYLPSKPMLFPLGCRKEPVTQKELYMAITDFDGRKEVCMSIEPMLAATHEIVNALGEDALQYNNNRS